MHLVPNLPPIRSNLPLGGDVGFGAVVVFRLRHFRPFRFTPHIDGPYLAKNFIATAFLTGDPMLAAAVHEKSTTFLLRKCLYSFYQ